MELFLELVFTVSFSLLFSFCFAWFLSIADAAELDLTKKKTSRVHNFQEDFEGCNLGMETKVGFGDDQRPKLFAGEVEKTEEKPVDEAQVAETQMGLIIGEVGMEGKEEKDHNSAENKSSLVHRVGVCSKSVKLDDQRLKLSAEEVEKTEEKPVDEAQTEMGLIKEGVGREEKYEKGHDSTENKTAFVHHFQVESVKLDDQSFKLSPEEVEKTEEKPVVKPQEAETEMNWIEEEVGIVCIDEKEEIGIKKSEIDRDDWVGIERSELERLFGAAVAFVDSKKGKTSSFSSDLKLQFFGLYQVAMAGPCLLPQPMALKFAARAKWDAWQQFGNLSSEEAMENYINLLSSNFPGWMEENVREPGISNDS